MDYSKNWTWASTLRESYLGSGCSKPLHCNLEDDLAAGGLVFIGLTRLRDRKHRSHDGLEFAGVDQASEHGKLGSVGLDDEESVAHALIASLFRGCGNGDEPAAGFQH